MACQTMSHQTQPPELETAFSCNIYHSQLSRLNNNIYFLVAFIKVIFRQADHQMQKADVSQNLSCLSEKIVVRFVNICIHQNDPQQGRQAQRTDVVFVKFCFHQNDPQASRQSGLQIPLFPASHLCR